MNAILLIALGGASGAVGRHLVSGWAARAFGSGFPYGTLAVNVIGSLAMGMLIAWLAKRSAGDAHLRLLLATGFLGGFTTFSAFSLDVALLYERGAWSMAATYILASVLLTVAAVFAGLTIMRSLLG
ncbi:MAG: fluoride efflux transporter CrcB [Pseudomonadota bacterium]